MTTVFTFCTGKLRQEILVDPAQDVLGAVLGVAQADGADQIDQLAQPGLVERGAGGFGIQRDIFDVQYHYYSVYAADLDGDGDIDVLSVGDGIIAWHENRDGAGDFGPQQVITTEADSARSVYAADLDGDGDIDVLSASRRDDKIAWYENLTPASPNAAQVWLFYR